MDSEEIVFQKQFFKLMERFGDNNSGLIRKIERCIAGVCLAADDVVDVCDFESLQGRKIDFVTFEELLCSCFFLHSQDFIDGNNEIHLFDGLQQIVSHRF
jgi:hypothetical protein